MMNRIFLAICLTLLASIFVTGIASAIYAQSNMTAGNMTAGNIKR